ncbi:fatty acyl-CoA reductase [Alkalimarinus sediminis]|uniref:Fatty acyl-CoA reductase n=1 Tax=Alkalimarinus sediminis TaxID=1632866 RepID=A0A9E8HKC6_9ALTE|nr:fatty acyl-CoA reductase [Alkalimarinus sediminis]UZW75737.1 fatty acyl-CoA reductase [Alkalimarinus sediminis]
MKNTKDSVVRQTLNGKNILITGCTGFLGKVLLEKIISSIPKVGSINILIRGSSAYKDGRERFEQEILTSSIFDSLREKDLAAFEQFCATKLNVITGELTEKNFGLGESQFSTLANKIDLIVNSAASVNFREALDKALKINTLCLNNIVELSERGDNIPVVQVSTCYVHGLNKGDIYEETKAPFGQKMPRNEKGQYVVESVIDLLKDKINNLRFPAKNPEELSKALVDLGIEEANRYGWNDTYTFTKWMGEQLLIEKLDGKSLAIVRPSIIESTLKGPVPGWIEGIKVADAIIFAYARGKIAFFPADPKGIMDIIPADLVANSIILSMTKVFVSPGETNIYQSCSSGSNPANISDLKTTMINEARKNYRKYPKLFKGKRPASSFNFVSKSIFDTAMKAIQLPLGLLNDVNSILGRESKNSVMLKNIDTALTLSTTFSFYGFPKYRFHNGKLLALAKELGEAGDSEFYVDAAEINWGEYFGKNHIAGLEKYAIKDKSKSTAVKAQKANVKQSKKAA